MFQDSVREFSLLRTLPLLIVNKFTLPSPPVSVVLWIILFLILLPPPISSLQRCLTDIYHPLPTSPPRVDHCTPGICPHMPPASLCRSSLRPTPRACFRRCVPRPFTPPCRPWPVPRSLSFPGGSSTVGHSVSVVSPPIYLPV